MMGFGMGFAGIWMIIFWVVIIGAGIWIIAELFPKGGSSPLTKADDDAFAILKKRYAQGELSKEEYESVRHDLETF